MRQFLFKSQQGEPAGHRWRRDRQAILEFNRSLALIVDLDALMASVGARLRELFGTDRVVILRAPTDGGMFSVAFSCGYSADELKGLHLGQQDRLAKWMQTNETPLVMKRDESVLDYLSAHEREMLAQLNASACLPLVALNRLTGMILLSSTQSDFRLSDEDLNLLQMLTSLASVAFENASLYQQQRDRLRQLYRAERLAAAGELAASVAHEIRNPLTSIRSTVQYLLGEFDEGHLKRPLVEGVISEVDRINQTVDGLLSLTRRVEVKPERLSLGQLIEQSLLLVGTKARNQAVEVNWSQPSPDVYVSGDLSQLKQLLLNLVLNALQAMPQGGRLQIELGRRRAPDEMGREKTWAEVTIKDTGCGISADNLEKIFDPFFTTKQGGTGLGLSISYTIARQHGGELEIASREGGGTTVAVRLPLVK
ncbi:MAG TPA: ATP-binding protein [Pyrinomonadaceae bacterium]|nr:ATP-binding protein [Pyrinomonadaceae bacterium]